MVFFHLKTLLIIFIKYITNNNYKKVLSMSDKKPNVFPSAEQISSANENTTKVSQQLNQENNVQDFNISEKERMAAEEMRRRTEEQMRLRDEQLAKNAKASEELHVRREELMSQTRESVQKVEPPVVPPVVPPTYSGYDNTGSSGGNQEDPYIQSISQPQMNQPYDVIPLPSKGKFYPGNKKSVKVAYLTTADENILTSPNLVESGKFLEILINRKLLEPGLRYKDLLPGDRNAIMIWLRATGYGEMYPITMTDENNKDFETEINLSELKTIELTVDPSDDGLYHFELPLAKNLVKFKLLNTGDIDELEEIVQNTPEGAVSQEQTLVLERQIVDVDGNKDRTFIKKFVNSMRVLDAQKLREFASEIKCDIDLRITVRTPGGESIDTFLPFTPRFFWPNSEI